MGWHDLVRRHDGGIKASHSSLHHQSNIQCADCPAKLHAVPVARLEVQVRWRIHGTQSGSSPAAIPDRARDGGTARARGLGHLPSNLPISILAGLHVGLSDGSEGAAMAGRYLNVAVETRGDQSRGRGRPGRNIGDAEEGEEDER